MTVDRDPTRLLLVVHNHQPVGNFDFVFEEATDKSYAPFVDLLAEHPRIRVGLHFTGPLLEWLESHRPGLLSTVRELCARGQVEILGGGWAEPMLSVLPDHDAVGQLRMMRDECTRLFGSTPRGMWLAERVWDPDLPRLLRAAEVEYTLLDDTHFRYAGVLDRRLTGHYVTEKAGEAVAIFPIDRELRYAIPFRRPAEAVEAIRSAGPGRTVTYGDDGEKFGVWPETYEWVWEKGWLKQLFGLLEDPEQGVELVLPSEQLDGRDATSRVYLPTASYHEMGEWTLGPEAGRSLLDLKQKLADEELTDAAEPFLQGGIWMGFLAKYSESNTLHKKMLRASAKVKAAAAERSPETVERARRALYRGQCNCPYWHGLFGGLYLPHLRHAVYRQLVEAEALIDSSLEGAQLEVADLDGDLLDEVALESRGAAVWIDPGAGGQITALDDRARRVSLAHVLTRRPETYHQDLLEAAKAPADATTDGPASIHGVHKSKVPDLEERLVYDAYDRRVLVDHLLAPGTGPGAVEGPLSEPADLVGLRYRVADRGTGPEEGAWVELTGSAELATGGSVQVVKKITLRAATVEVVYRLGLEGAQACDAVFAVESAFALVPGTDRFTLTQEEPAAKQPPPRCSPQERGSWPVAQRFVAGSSLGDAELEVTVDPGAELAWFPLETVSQSEDGAELVYQGTVITAAWPCTLTADETFERRLTIRMR